MGIVASLCLFYIRVCICVAWREKHGEYSSVLRIDRKTKSCERAPLLNELGGFVCILGAQYGEKMMGVCVALRGPGAGRKRAGPRIGV